MVSLSRFDLFALPVSLFAARRQTYSGSFLGFVVSATLVICLLSFMSYKYKRMMTQSDDLYAS